MIFRPLTSQNSDKANWGQVNDMIRTLNKEQQVKVFKGANNIQAIVNGKYAEGRYGILISDDAGFRRILVGQAPDDGRPGIWISQENRDVIDELEA
jgi:hypothetical protein